MSDRRLPEKDERFVGFETLPVRITVRVGATRCSLRALAELKPGDVIDLDRRVGEPFDLRAEEVLLGCVEPVSEKDGVAVKLIDVAEEDDDLGG